MREAAERLPGGAVPNELLGTLLLLTHSDTLMSGVKPCVGNGLPAIWSRIEILSSKATGKAMREVLCENMELLCSQL